MKDRSCGVIVAASLLAGVGTVKSASLLPHRAVQDIDSIFQQRYSDPLSTRHPGGAVVIAKGDDILYERYFGMADLNTDKAVDAATTFNIASVSKQFTVIGLLRLAQDGAVDLSMPLSTWFDYPQGFWKEVTPLHIASQSSGIPDERDRSDRMRTIHATDESSCQYFPHIRKLRFAPGTAYDYVNPTFILLSRIIEKVTGTEFTVYQRDNLFGPAGMMSTYYFNPTVTPPAQSHAYQPDGNGGWEEFDYGEETFFATRPDGGIYSTARDMLRWERALANHSVIGAVMLDSAYAPHTDVASSILCDYQRRPHTWYGLGWFVEKRPDMPLLVYHTGDNGGYQAYVAKYPEHDVSVIVLENRHDGDRRRMALDIEWILMENNVIGKTDE